MKSIIMCNQYFLRTEKKEFHPQNLGREPYEGQSKDGDGDEWR